jgi:multidrug efflux pump subunit AcrA (membrane-fusion protein)
MLIKQTSGLLCIALLLLFTACSESKAPNDSLPETEETVPEVLPSSPAMIQKKDLKLHSVRNQAREVKSQISGRVIPKNQTQIVAEVPGRTEQTSVSFKQGVAFRKGDVLVKMASTEFALQLESQRSTFLNALTGIMPDLKSDYPESYPNWLSYIEDYQVGERLRALPEPQSKEERYFITSNQVYSLYYGIKSAEERLRKHTVIAPYNGVIVQSGLDLGSYVNPGQPLGAIMGYTFELEAGADLATAEAISIGDVVTFQSNKVSGSCKGRVVRKGKTVNPQTQNISIFFQLSGKGLLPGMYLEGDIVTDQTADIAVVPSDIIGRDQSVLLLDSDVIRRQVVTPVRYLEDSVIVSGLEDGAKLILNSFDTPVDGSKIEG